MDAEATSVKGTGLLVRKEDDDDEHCCFRKIEDPVADYSLCIGSYPN